MKFYLIFLIGFMPHIGLAAPTFILEKNIVTVVKAPRLELLPESYQGVEVDQDFEAECSEFPKNMMFYRQFEDRAIYGMVDFLSVFIQYNHQWYRQLRPLEGEPAVDFAVGDFGVISDAALKLRQAADNFEMTALGLEELLYKLYSASMGCFGPELSGRIFSYNERSFVTLQALSEYLAEISKRLRLFYQTISVFEGVEVSVGAETFLPLALYASEAEGQGGLGEAKDLILKKFTFVYHPELDQLITDMDNLYPKRLSLPTFWLGGFSQVAGSGY